jgi:NitT/TauT family transport system permease protein
MLSIIILLIFWKVVSLIIDKEILVPSPEKTFIEIINIMQSAYFIPSLVNTLKRALVGFVMAVGIGIFLGMMGGLFKPIYYLLRPIVLVNKAVPTMAMILLALIWLESEKAPLLVGFVVIFPIIYENVVQGIRNVDVKLIEMMNIYEVSPWDMIKELYIPSMGPYLYGAMSAAMGLNLKIIIAAEVLSQPSISMGTSFQIEKANLNTVGVFAWSLITIVLAGLLEQSMRAMRRN